MNAGSWVQPLGNLIAVSSPSNWFSDPANFISSVFFLSPGSLQALSPISWKWIQMVHQVIFKILAASSLLHQALNTFLVSSLPVYFGASIRDVDLPLYCLNLTFNSFKLNLLSRLPASHKFCSKPLLPKKLPRMPSNLFCGILCNCWAEVYFSSWHHQAFCHALCHISQSSL